jgi:predicted O-methyltransferase YrrM
MDQELWTDVDRYLVDAVVQPDGVLDAALATSQAAGLPSINVSASQGKLLMVLARGQGARRILEIGTLGGYSTIWLARALPPGGRLMTLEANPLHAEVALSNIARAGLSEVVELRQGKAVDTLRRLATEGHEPFDFIFIDADKPGYVDYFDWSLKLARPGTLIFADNVVRSGNIADPEHRDENVQAARRFHERVAAEPRVQATVMQTVGAKGYDGFTLAVVTE